MSLERKLRLAILLQKVAEVQKKMDILRVQERIAGDLAKEVESLCKQLSEAENVAGREKEVEALMSQNLVLLQENKRLSSMVSENVDKLKTSEDTLRVLLLIQLSSVLCIFLKRFHLCQNLSMINTYISFHSFRGSNTKLMATVVPIPHPCFLLFFYGV